MELRTGATSCSYSPECVEGVFYELRVDGVLGNSRKLAYWIGFSERSGPGAEFAIFTSQLLAT